MLTANWSVELPFPMAMRIEDGSLVFWHGPERMTLWLTVAQGLPEGKGRVALDELKETIPAGAFDLVEDRARGLLLCSYRFAQGAYNATEPSLYGFAVAGHGEHVLFAAHFNLPEQIEPATRAWRSLEWHEA